MSWTVKIRKMSIARVAAWFTRVATVYLQYPSSPQLVALGQFSRQAIRGGARQVNYGPISIYLHKPRGQTSRAHAIIINNNVKARARLRMAGPTSIYHSVMEWGPSRSTLLHYAGISPPHPHFICPTPRGLPPSSRSTPLRLSPASIQILVIEVCVTCVTCCTTCPCQMSSAPYRLVVWCSFGQSRRGLITRTEALVLLTCFKFHLFQTYWTYIGPSWLHETVTDSQVNCNDKKL